jgi:hypothetical protein
MTKRSDKDLRERLDLALTRTDDRASFEMAAKS